MENAVRFLRVDIMTVKPYFKQIMLTIICMTCIGFAFGNYASALSMAAVFSILMAGYPFSIGERNNLDCLYSTLSLSRRDIVAGRYLFSLASLFFTMIVAMLFYMTILSLLHKAFNAPVMAAGILIGVALFSMIISVQYPILFKYGYTKARAFIVVPFILIGVLGSMIGSAASSESQSVKAVVHACQGYAGYFSAHPAHLYIGIIAASAALLLISFLFSRKFYSMREF